MEERKLVGKIVDRESFILSKCKNKRVLHLGCTDWPYTETKFKKNFLLHSKLNKISRELYGIDLNIEGINFLRAKGMNNLILLDVEELEKLGQNKYEVIIAGELIEHLHCLKNFFKGVVKIMNEESILIITTPNAFSFKSFFRAFTGKELIHPDHFYYFSYSNLEHLASCYGFEIVDIFYYLSRSENLFKRILSKPFEFLIKHFIPQIGDGIIIVLKIKL